MKKSLLLIAFMVSFGTMFAQWISDDHCFTYQGKQMPLCLSTDGQVSILSQPQHGTLVAFTDTKFTYTADEGFVGNDSFQYQIMKNGISEIKWYTVDVYDTPEPSDVVSDPIPEPNDNDLHYRVNESGCPSIVIGVDDTLVPCSTNHTLVADVVATGLTTNSYTYQMIPFQPPFGWTSGTPILVGIDDRWGEVRNLPFGFCFYGNTYNQVIAGSNSCISFNTNLAGEFCNWSFSSTIPSANFPIKNGVLACYRDIYPVSSFLGPQGGMYEDVMGEFPCRAYCVTWYNIALFSCTSINNFITMIVLYEGTNIIDVYMKYTPTCTTWQNGAGVLGLINNTGQQACCPPGRNTGPWVAQNEAWRFTPVGNPEYDVTWYLGTDTTATPIGTGDSLDVLISHDTTYTARLTYTSCNGTHFDIVNTIDMYVMPNNFQENLTACDHITIQDTTFYYPTTHTVVFSNDYGCDSIVTYNINVLPAPTISSIIGTENMIISGDLYTGIYNFQIDPVNNCDSVTWFLSNKTWYFTPNPADPDNMYKHTIYCTSHGHDTINVIAWTSDCGPTYAQKPVSGSEYGVQEDLNNSLSIRPNPTNGNIAIELANLTGMYNINVYNSNGTLVDNFVMNAENNVYNYNMSNQPNGVYYFSIANSETQVTRKVVLLR